MIHWAIFASGNGTNAEAIIKYFETNLGSTQIKVVLCNKPDAYVLERAKKYDIPTEVFSKDDLYNTKNVYNILKKYEIHAIALAGFNLLLPENIVKALPDYRILNLHPALLPKYGGKGMYGINVHEAVLANKEEESGITVHYVNEKYDEGLIIEQVKCEVKKDDTPQTLAQRIHELEHLNYPRIIHKESKQMALSSVFSGIDPVGSPYNDRN